MSDTTVLLSKVMTIVRWKSTGAGVHSNFKYTVNPSYKPFIIVYFSYAESFISFRGQCHEKSFQSETLGV